MHSQNEIRFVAIMRTLCDPHTKQRLCGRLCDALCSQLAGSGLFNAMEMAEKLLYCHMDATVRQM